MSQILAAASALALLAQASTPLLKRDPHDDTIYTVSGTQDQLVRFQTEIASQWEGGKLFNQDKGKSIYRYWAFPNRTAPQSREFMFGALRSGLSLDIQAYDQKQLFPIERSTLDDIATTCGLIRDPFFITPGAELTITFGADERALAVDCATLKLMGAALPNILKRPTG